MLPNIHGSPVVSVPQPSLPNSGQSGPFLVAGGGARTASIRITPIASITRTP